MQAKESFKLFLLFVTAVATSVAAYATYQMYGHQARKPVLALVAYKIDGAQEATVVDTTSLVLKKIKSEGGFNEFELPIKLSNTGDANVEDILMHIDVEGGELIIPADWTVGTYADSPRYYKDINKLTPFTGRVLRDVKLRVKDKAHEAKLKWSILAKDTIPPSGELKFHF